MAPLTPPHATFRELEQLGLEIEVTCQKCGHRSVIDPREPSLADRRIAGRRYRCRNRDEAGRPCGGIGLPSIGPRIGKQRTWTERAAKHTSALRWPKPGSDSR